METHGITISLIHNDDVDLSKILDVIGEHGKQSTWKISGVECIGSSSELLHTYSDNCELASGEELYQICSNNLQVIEREFAAVKKSEKSSWV